MNAILNSRNEIIGFTREDTGEIRIASAIAANGAPVNARVFRVSKSQANRAKICSEMASTIAHEHAGRVFYTLEG